MHLGAFLADAATRPWVWGEHDCCAMPARWAGVVLPYRSEAEADELIAAAGGLERLWVDVAGDAIEPVLGDPEPGDVGIITALSPDREVIEIGAIWNGRRWSFVPRSGGVAAASATALSIWRPRCLKP